MFTTIHTTAPGQRTLVNVQPREATDFVVVKLAGIALGDAEFLNHGQYTHAYTNTQKHIYRHSWVYIHVNTYTRTYNFVTPCYCSNECRTDDNYSENESMDVPPDG